MDTSNAKRRAIASQQYGRFEQQLAKATEAGTRFKLWSLMAFFSMDGLVAPLDKICDLVNMTQWLWSTNVTQRDSLAQLVKEHEAKGVYGPCGYVEP
jgi:hypothetical protein